MTDTSLIAWNEPSGPINLRTLILIRWIAIAGQASTILIVHYGLGFRIPLIQALGVVAYGPFPWADGKRTEDIDRVLGDNRILWLETAHFRIGSTLKPIDVADDPEARKDVLAECTELSKRLAKLPKRPKKLEAWHRLHLYALRAETMYGDFARMARPWWR